VNDSEGTVLKIIWFNWGGLGYFPHDHARSAYRWKMVLLAFLIIISDFFVCDRSLEWEDRFLRKTGLTE